MRLRAGYLDSFHKWQHFEAQHALKRRVRFLVVPFSAQTTLAIDLCNIIRNCMNLGE